MEELRKKAEKDIDTRSEHTLRSHQQKIAEVEDKINQVNGRLGHAQDAQDAQSAEKAKDEIKAEELRLQQKEFVWAVDGFRQKLHSLQEQDEGYERAVQALRKQLGIEVCRLQKALPMYARRQEVVDLVKVGCIFLRVEGGGSGASVFNCHLLSSLLVQNLVWFHNPC
jgi:chromosome segregation ATPase